MGRLHLAKASCWALSWAQNSQRRVKNGQKIKHDEGGGINYGFRQSCGEKDEGEKRKKEVGECHTTQDDKIKDNCSKHFSSFYLILLYFLHS